MLTSAVHSLRFATLLSAAFLAAAAVGVVASASAQPASVEDSASTPHAAAVSRANRIARLEALTANQPDEPGLAWALARAYADAGRPDEAAEAFDRYLDQWPDRQPTAHRRLGRVLVEAGRPDDAIPHLESALATDPDDAVAHLFLGLALLSARRAEARALADPHLERAGELAPELRKSTDLLRGTSALNAGNRPHGEALLDDLASDETGTVETRLASVLMQRRRVADGPRSRFRIQIDGGVEHDSNVTLDSGLDLPGIPTDQRDWRFQFGGSLGVDLWRSERARLHVGYRYDQTEHQDLEAFDLQSHQAFGSAQLAVHPRVWLRVDARGAWTKLDHVPYVDSWAVSPGLWIELGERAGALRLFGLLERNGFDSPPLLSSLERDGWQWGGGAEHVAALPFRRGAWLATALRYRRTETDAATDVLGFDSAFDAHRYELGLRASVPLFWRTRLEASARVAAERFDNINVIDRLTDDGLGDPTPGRRNDWLYEFRTALVRPIGRFVDVELALRNTYRVSNVDVYAYQRRIAGIYITVHTP